MASVLPANHCYQRTGVEFIQPIAMLRGTPRLHNHPQLVHPECFLHRCTTDQRIATTPNNLFGIDLNIA